MKKNRLTMLIVAILTSILITSNVFAYEYEKVGWINEGKPKFTWATLNPNGTLKDYSSHLKKTDISGSTIMSRLRSSYSLKGRASKIKDSIWMQNKLLVPTSPTNNFDYTNITYYNSPMGLGYTSWYDSPYGVFIDYTSQFSPEYLGKVIDTTHKNVDIVKDSIDFANIQYSNTNSAYLTTTKRGMGDSRVAAMSSRAGKNYPIYLNNGENIDDRVKSAMQKKGIKNIYVLGGSTVFNYTAGLTSGFNVIRAGGLNREETKNLMLKLPYRVEGPQHYPSDSNGIVMVGVDDKYKATIRGALEKEKKAKDGSNLIAITKYLNDVLKLVIGSEPNKNSNPTMVIGVNDGEYEAYWICYWNSPANGYVYQFVLNGYHTDNININSEVTSVETSNTVYKQNNSTYWTKTNTDVNINTRGTVNVKSDMNSIKLQLYNSSYSNINNSPYHEMTPGTIGTNSQFSTSFSNATTQKAVLGTYNNLRAITGKHTIRAKESGKSYLLHTSAQYGFWSNPISSGINLKTDGDAPIVSGIPSSEDREGPFEFTLKAIDSLSGVKSMTLTRNGKTITGTNSITTTVDEEGENKFVVSSIDNVGNVFTKEFIVNIDRNLTISGVIDPNPSPAGKKVSMDITTIGKAKRIKIVFPDELVKLATVDSPLTFEKAITVEPTHKERIHAWLPLETPVTLDKDNIRVKPAYKIYIEAENTYGKIVTGYIDLDVQGSIFDKLQYGIKATGYDRKK